jgi:hypothetical protein
VLQLAALANGRFLLVYAARQQLVARGIDKAGRFRGEPHVLATRYTTKTTIGDTLPPVSVESDPSRAVVVWGPVNGTTDRVVGAIDDQAGWSRSKVFYSVKSSGNPFFVQLASDSQDRFLVSVHGSNGDTTAVMWGLPSGSRQWEQVTTPQAAGGSQLAAINGATVASVNGAITAAWQDASAALVVSTWDGSTWTTPVTAIAGSQSNGYAVVIYPVFVSDGSRAAIVWSDTSNGFLGPVEATIRASSGAGWSAPLVFPHSRGQHWLLHLSTTSEFWFTASGDLAGVWGGDPVTGSGGTGLNVAGLYVGRVGAGGASATVLSRTQSGTTGRIWLALERAGGLHTVVWANRNGSEFSATATRDGVVRQKQRLPATCRSGFPLGGVSNPDASAQLLVAGVPVRGNAAKCSTALFW